MEAPSDVRYAPRPGRRLILVGPYPAPWGGISVHVRALRDLAQREDIPVEVLDVGKGHGSRDGSEGVYSAGSYGSFLSRLLAASTGDAVLHTHVPGNNLKSWIVALAASRARPGGLLSVHSGLAPSLIQHSMLVRQMARLACSRYDWVLCANGDIAAALELAGVAPERLEVLPAFVAGPVSMGEPPQLAKVARGRHKILLSAALAPGVQYGEEILLEGLEILSRSRADAGCVIFGPGSDSPALQERIGNRGLFGRVVCLGELDQPQALAVMSLSDVFVRPTLADGDSISVREALSLGIRVVASDVGHRPPEATLFAPGDPDDLAYRIATALENPPPETGAGGADMARRIVAWWRAVGLDQEGVFV